MFVYFLPEISLKTLQLINKIKWWNVINHNNYIIHILLGTVLWLGHFWESQNLTF